MNSSIRVLHLEDNARDAEIIRELLDADGIECAISRVSTRQDFEDALRSGGYDIVLTDNNLPSYDGSSALRAVQALRPTLPVIVISGSIGEYEAVRSLQFGATDYLLKSRLERLSAAFRRALSEARERQAREVAEQELRANEERMRLALTATNDAIWDWDLGQNRMVVNTTFRRVFGSLDEGENPRTWWHQHSHPDDRIATKASLDAAINAGQAYWAATFRLRRLDGTWASVQNRACLAKDATGAVSRIIGAVQDMTSQVQAETERRQLEEQLRQAQKIEAIGTLAGGIAHDFNNILGIILANVELAKRDVPADSVKAADLQESLGEIYGAANRARDLVRQILTFSRRSPSERKLIKSQPIVRECVKLLRTTMPAIVKITERIDPASPCIHADPTQLHQVVMNICTNAWHALPEKGGSIQVSVGTCVPAADVLEANPILVPGDHVCITIADDGHGMDARTKARIFEPFFTTKPAGKGTGLGLAVVHGIVKSHGGAITLASEPGVGTTFTIYFPAVAEGVPVEESSQVTTYRGHGERILIVDDDAAMGRAIQRQLKKDGYQAELYHRPELALEVLRGAPHACDLVITDYSMPEMNGIDFATRALQLRPELPVILISGTMELEDQTRAELTAFRARLNKPVLPAELAEAIAHALPSTPKTTLS